MNLYDLHDRIDEMKETQFLRYLSDQAAGDEQTTLNVGEAGEALGLPYEEAIRIADELREDGYLRRVGRFNAPQGPGVQVTRQGFRAAYD